ncbi:MAG: hypothetical protein JNM57_04275 [Cyclobacteriaceae bacterium]|nr:hypothetical protein [Cyclobacteriaceae bacterium]
MKSIDAQYYLKKIKQQHRLRKVVEALLYSAAFFFALYALLQLLGIANTHQLVFSVSCAVLFFVFLGYKIFHINESRIINFINHRYPFLEESADLLLQEDQNLNSLQRLQKSKIFEQFKATYKSIRLPLKLGQAAGLLCVSILIFLIAQRFYSPTSEHSMAKDQPSTENIKHHLPVAMERATITISPPTYTLIRPYTVNDFNLSIPEGSSVTWSITFSDSSIQAQIIMPDDTLVLRHQKNNNVEISRSFNKSSIYQFRWITKNGMDRTSDFYSISVTPDKPPSIVVQDISPFTSLALSDKLSISLTSVLQDDYSVTDAYIIATVSKGSGESVKFREEKLRFSQPEKIVGKEVKAKRTLDLLSLGLEPGDELYFYVEALDNKVPIANRIRTETYFISLQDTASENSGVEAGLGVDLLPDYFRSQRQIIIDTEKLLKDKKFLMKNVFNSTSNALGHDQKVLRLRYGQFLGEEFESGIGPQAKATEEEHPEEDVTKKFGHTHDTEKEHNLVEEKKEKDDHGHQHTADQSENPLEGFIHEHDNAEEATFFIQSIKLKLKAALTLMWDAELYLRLYEPAKSLPYQYQTLKLLKEISNESRIYVHRTGFDPPPVKEDKRLTGELTNVKSTRAQSTTESQLDYPEIRRALSVMEHTYAQKEVKLSSTDKAILQKAGNELATLALEHPEKYLTTLSLLKALHDDEINPEKLKDAVREIRKNFWEALPVKTPSPYALESNGHPLNQLFMKQLNDLNHE